MMWEAKDAFWCCFAPLKILFDSLKILLTNKLVFCSIFSFTTLPLSFITITLTFSTHALRTHVFHLEALASVAQIHFEARHLWHEAREDAVSLIRTSALFSLLCFPISLAAAVSTVQSTLSAVQGSSSTVKSAAAAVRKNWKPPFVTAIFVYIILLAFYPVPRVLTAPLTSLVSRCVVKVIVLSVEVYLMAFLNLGLVVSISEERFGLDAIWVGSSLMQGRKFCGWVLSGLFVLVSGWINRRVEMLLDAPNSAGVGFWDKTVVIFLYGLAILLSYVITTVFYCDARRRHVTREPEAQDDDEDLASVDLAL